MRQLQMLVNISSPPFDLQTVKKRTNNALVAKLLLDFCFSTDKAFSHMLEERSNTQGCVVINYYFSLLLTLKRQTKRLLINVVN